MLTIKDIICTVRVGRAALPLLLLSGCMVGPAYKGPPATAAQDLRQPSRVAAVPAPPATRVALDTWWTGFNDPVLTRIVERAASQNLDLAAAIARVDQARAAAQEAGAQRLPRGDVRASVNQMHQSLTGPIGAVAHDLPGYYRNQRSYDVGAGAGWEPRSVRWLEARSGGRDRRGASGRGPAPGLRVSVVARRRTPTSRCAVIRRGC